MTDRSQRKLQRLTLQRTACKTNVRKELDKLTQLMQGQDPNVNEVETQLSTAQYFIDQVLTLDSEVLDCLMETDDDMSSEIEEASSFRSEVVVTVKSVEGFLRASSSKQSNTASDLQSVSGDNVGGMRTHAKLPKLELPSFRGDPIKWQAFWDSFDSKVHNDDTIPNIDKLHYLLRLLDGEAADAVLGYRPTASNYPVVISVLRERFGNPETAKFKHLEALFAIPSAESDVSKLKDVYNECEKHIRCLVALGLTEDTFGQVFVPLILSKLPRSTRLLLHRAQGDKDWDIKSLCDLMKQEIVARDLSDRFVKGFGTNQGAAEKGGKGNKEAFSKPTNKGFQAKPRFNRNWVTQGSLLTTSNHQTTSQPPKCAFCGASHYSDACTQFPTVERRKSVLHNNCFKCLGAGHRVLECKRAKPCYYCKAKDHHSSLCYKQFKNHSAGSANDTKGTKHDGAAGNSYTQPQVAMSTETLATFPKQTVLKMATVRYPNLSRPVHVYFDDGSSTSYVTHKLAQEINLNLSDYQYSSVGRFGSSKRQTQRYQKSFLPIPLSDGTTATVPVHVVDTITSAIQKVPLDPTKHPALYHLPLADTMCTSPEMVQLDVLIGGDFLHQLMTGERLDVGNGLYLYGSKLGYIAAGTVEAPALGTEQIGVSLLIQTNRLSDSSVERFWSLEEIGIKDDPYSSDNDLALERFNQTLCKAENRYQVGLPWRRSANCFPDHYGLAFGRLSSLVKRLHDKPDLLLQYNGILEDQLKAGIIEEVKPSATNSVHYIPHHCVSKPNSTTTKLRIVYDASAKLSKKSPSLNDMLFRGPVVVQDLCGFLLRFRTSRVVVLCDIEKAFHQISIDWSDRNVLRFLWLKNINLPVSAANLKTFRFSRVPFGMVCSPFLLDQCIRHHLMSKGTEVATDILENIYVDNIQGGKLTAEEAVQYYRQTKDYFQEISMNVREWLSNSQEFLKNIPTEDRGQAQRAKVLGLPWCTCQDVISLVEPQFGVSWCNTKRQLLSTASAIFDPCGWLAPIITNLKLKVQELWKSKVGWDQTLSDPTVVEITQLLTELRSLSSMKLPRLVSSCIAEPGARHQLHCFVDASAKAYAAVVYIRSKVPSGKVSVGLAFAKVRLAPIKPITIPRLELLACVIGCRIIGFVEKQLKSKVCIEEKFVWSDSKCVLHWIQTPHKLKVFVQNRITEIRSVQNTAFRYVPTSYNPADIPTRGTSLELLRTMTIWWSGPNFLLLEKDMWPENIAPIDETEETQSALADEQVRLSAAAHVTLHAQGDVCEIIPVTKFSSWNKLLRVMGFVLQAVAKFRSRVHTTTANIEREFRLDHACAKRATILLVRLVQKSLDPKFTNSLNPIEHENGIVRITSRLMYSDLSHDAQRPILLPKNHHITQLLIRSYHENLAHAGANQTLANFRQHYWVIGGRQQVQKVISNCTHCRKTKGGPFKVPEFPQLPPFRVTAALPFENVGIDYFGPLLVIDPNVTGAYKKIWVALFACCVTRAVHLDLVSELSAEQFLLCFRRFASLFGMPKIIVSDNAKQFHATNKVFQTAAKDWADHNFVQWKFITENAPWMGGFYERLVGTVKVALRKTLGPKRLKFEQLQTLLFETTAIVNTRPLVQTPTDSDPQLTLTPAHFLAKRGRVGPPSLFLGSEYTERQNHSVGHSLLELWKAGSRILDEYWRCWRNEYLASLRERSNQFKQRNCSNYCPKLGTVVLIKEDLPRCKWRIGVISHLRKSTDGLCRSAEVRMADGKVLNRPIKLCTQSNNLVSTIRSHQHNRWTHSIYTRTNKSVLILLRVAQQNYILRFNLRWCPVPLMSGIEAAQLADQDVELRLWPVIKLWPGI